MKILKSERGMALITVILMFALFTVLGLGIFSAINNNSKQIVKTETTNQATDIAEMGITYYKNAVEEKIEEINELGTGSIEDYFTTLKEKLAVIQVKNQISVDDVYYELMPIQNESDYNVSGTEILANYMRTYLDLDEDNEKIGVILRSQGTAKGETRELSLHLVYSILLNTEGNFSIDIPKQNELSIDCGETLSSEKYSKHTCVYEGNQFIGTMFNISDSTIYISGDLNISNDANNIDGGLIHVEGDLKIEGDLNNLRKSSILEVEGNAEIDIINDTRNNFILFVGKNLTVNQLKKSVRDYSTFIVLGTTDIKSGLENINGTCKLCAYHGVVGYENNTTDRIFVPEDPDFNTQCGSFGGPASYILNSTPDEKIDYH